MIDSTMNDGSEADQESAPSRRAGRIVGSNRSGSRAEAFQLLNVQLK
jgi:hypothetical protein